MTNILQILTPTQIQALSNDQLQKIIRLADINVDEIYKNELAYIRSFILFINQKIKKYNRNDNEKILFIEMFQKFKEIIFKNINKIYYITFKIVYNDNLFYVDLSNSKLYDQIDSNKINHLIKTSKYLFDNNIIMTELAHENFYGGSLYLDKDKSISTNCNNLYKLIKFNENENVFIKYSFELFDELFYCLPNVFMIDEHLMNIINI